MQDKILLPIEKATEVKDSLSKCIGKFSSTSKPLLADLRLEVSNVLAASALNGNVKGATRDYGADIGVRVFYGKKVVAGGFAGKSLGLADFNDIEKVAQSLLQLSLKRAKYNSAIKEKEMKKFKKQNS